MIRHSSSLSNKLASQSYSGKMLHQSCFHWVKTIPKVGASNRVQDPDALSSPSTTIQILHVMHWNPRPSVIMQRFTERESKALHVDVGQGPHCTPKMLMAGNVDNLRGRLRTCVDECDPALLSDWLMAFLTLAQSLAEGKGSQRVREWKWTADGIVSPRGLPNGQVPLTTSFLSYAWSPHPTLLPAFEHPTRF